ncbi:type II iodothyronine deiodinase-like [Penaeus chinensis]|uniref:type II iodothyronine deiodinase-like n=1 Tax=Penaeus chinensis TaxID=139456 RepID=UPI001FB62450|nr:type II iodothyronine deiodinase-like [Penaeus chinensis]XP_047474698.1 type II iodothyronine deiodinase-like [Penaeus chinensis]
MANLEKFRKITAEYSNVADFILIYISEAHPTDGWAIEGNVFQVANHKNMEEREAAAKQMLEMEPQDCPVFLDKLDNAANRVFAALPERLYIINRGTVVYKGGQGPFKYDLEEVEEWLKTHQEKTE